MPDADTRAERGELVELGRGGPVAAGHGDPPGQHDARDAGHARAADADEVHPAQLADRHRRRPASPGPCPAPLTLARRVCPGCSPLRRPPCRSARRPRAGACPRTTSTTAAASRRSASRRPAAAAACDMAATSSGSSRTGSSVSVIQSGLSSASSTISPPPASLDRRGVQPLLAVAVRQRHVRGGQAHRRELGAGHRAGPAQREVRGRVGEVHPVQVRQHDVGRSPPGGGTSTSERGPTMCSTWTPAARIQPAAAEHGLVQRPGALRAAGDQQHREVGPQAEVRARLVRRARAGPGRRSRAGSGCRCSWRAAAWCPAGR